MLAGTVVEKIAAQAASEIPSAGGRSGGVLGVGDHADLGTRPTVSADLSGASANLVIEVSLAYPSPIADCARQIRERVVGRVRDLAGVEVSRVDVVVTSLTRVQKPARTLR
ncbi:MAG: Asp23/Gls24 family envelope stress response protein [Ornithinimicrobium sp.]